MDGQTIGPEKAGKRSRPDGSRISMSYPRKRAVTACQLCRARKRKCNNARPKCKFCEDAEADCIYGDPQDHSSFDPASLVIIERLNQVLERLDAPLAWSSQVTLPNSHVDPSLSQIISTGPLDANLPSPNGAYPQIQRRESEVEEFMKIPSSRTTADTILTWPIFDGIYPPNYLVDALFATENGAASDDECSSNEVNNTPRTLKKRPVSGKFSEDDIESLVDNFIAHVHIKNPILEVETLRGQARRVIEEGPGWDGASCLVFLACALGALAKPFKNYGQSLLSDTDSTTRFQKELAIAESNYALARRRIGLLSGSIVRSQCFFWSGVYLMYSLRPVEAWQNFLQASSTYHIYLKGHMKRNEEEALYVSKNRLLEQRLYWSCFKSECEIRVELDLPESSIASIAYPDMFPSPPNAESSAVTVEDSPSISSFDTLSPSGLNQPTPQRRRTFSTSHSHQQSWYYYLSEIALRRIANSVLNAFYTTDHYPGYNMPVPLMVKTAENFLLQMAQWYEGLPSAIKYNEDGLDEFRPEELSHMTQGRALEIKTWLSRPFLYYAIHHPADDPYRSAVEPFFEDAMKTARAYIRQGTVRHRHHGTWFQLRHGTAAALSLLAANKCGHIIMPADWKDTVRSHISVLEHWELESPDLSRAKEILNAMMLECNSV